MNSATIELVSLNATVRRAIGKTFVPGILYGDNTSAIQCASKQGSPKLKHLTDIKQHFIMYCNLKGLLNINWVSSKEQEADILTKALPKDLFIKLRMKIIDEC